MTIFVSGCTSSNELKPMCIASSCTNSPFVHYAFASPHKYTST